MIGRLAGGSIRDPAVAHGIYGFRPSHDGKATPDVVIPCGYASQVLTMISQ